MSLATRQIVAHHPHLSFQRESQQDDLLNPNVTQTQLIAALQHLLAQGWHIQITAVVSDHHNDESLCFAGSPWCGTHAHGWAADLWPMDTNDKSKFMSASDPHFAKFLGQCASLQYLHQIGLAGEADTQLNHLYAGPTSFSDGGESHIHIGLKTT